MMDRDAAARPADADQDATRWLEGLNPEQRQAVVHDEGPLLVLAGAGSGKTRVLTYRIAYLLARGVYPGEILAVTFTNKAAREMRERAAGLVGRRADGVWIGTFHATCVQILRRHTERLGFTNRFLIFDTGDQQQAIARVYKELNLDPKRHDARGTRAAISAAKNELIDVDRFADDAKDPHAKATARVYRRYQEVLKENDALDFDDLLTMTVRLFRREPELLERYQNRFRHIMVDEYQDTNHAQYVLIKMLAEKHRNLCVVGDADQSIYAFRGADIRNILNFERDYPDAKVIKLERNYRSTRHILEAANHVIEHNRDRPEKVLWTDNEEGAPVVWCRTPSERDEAGFVADEIERLRREEGIKYGDVALLYRTHAQSRALEETFIRRGTPYRMVAGTRFYERREIKDIVAYLRAIANPADSFSVRRIINVPKRGIGDVTVGRIEEGAERLGIPLYEALVHPDVTDMLSAAATRRVAAFHEMIERFREWVEQGRPLTRIAEEVMHETGYMDELRNERTLESEARIENLKEFLTVTSQFEAEQGNDLDEFLEHVALVSDVDGWDPEADAVAMMTVHSAKGLEFPVVFMVGMEEGVFPHSRSLWEAVGIEEERRLCYVAMTRARRRLYMSCALSRTLMGAVAHNAPSRFIDEIPSHLLQEETVGGGDWMTVGAGPGGGEGGGTGGVRGGTGGFGRSGAGGFAGGSAGGFAGSHWLSKETTAESTPTSYKPGQKVHHPVFGGGTVVAAEPSGGDWMVTVAFDGQGVKKLMAGLAKLEVV